MQKTDFRYELLIGEDCSTDGTREIVREYSRKYPEIVHAELRESNGARENLRRIFAASTGTYLALLEGDDYWTSPESCRSRRICSTLILRPLSAGHPCVWRREDGSLPDTVVPDLPGGFYGIENLLRGDILNTCSVMFRRVAEDVAPECYKHLAMGDLPLFVELARHGNVYLCEETMGAYRIHAGGLWSGMAAIRREREGQAVYQAFYERLDRNTGRCSARGCSSAHSIWASRVFRPPAGVDQEMPASVLAVLRTFEYVPQKLWLAFKGYCWWSFVAWRRLRQSGVPRNRPSPDSVRALSLSG